MLESTGRTPLSTTEFFMNVCNSMAALSAGSIISDPSLLQRGPTADLQLNLLLAYR
jgi:hypothetical protein